MFVPVVRHRAREEELTARGRDLGERLATAIKEFQRQYPGTSDADVRSALQHAAGRTNTGPARRAPMVPALVAAAVAAMGGLFGLFAQGSSGGAPKSVPIIAAAIAAIAVALIAVVVRNRSH